MVSKLINTLAFIIFIPDLFFTLPKNGKRKVVAAVHGILYSLIYTLLTMASDSKGRKKCADSVGMDTGGDDHDDE